MEFMGITTIMFIVFVIFTAVAAVRMGELEDEKNIRNINDLAEVISSELEIASYVENGYSREFFMPARLGGKAYAVQIIEYDGMVVNQTTMLVKYVNFSMNSSFHYKLPNNVFGQLNTGGNNITKTGGRVCVNQLVC
ncbi:MAG: hypothetical protein ABH879_03325 [archaeon]